MASTLTGQSQEIAFYPQDYAPDPATWGFGGVKPLDQGFRYWSVRDATGPDWSFCGLVAD